MQCPRCGKDNPDNEQVCASCGFLLTPQSKDDIPHRAKISKLAIIVMVCNVAAVLLAYFMLGPTLAFIAAALGIVAAIRTGMRIKKSEGRLRGKWFTIFGAVIPAVLCCVVSYWGIDAPPLEKNYALADLRSAPPEYNHTYDLLNSLGEPDANTMGAPSIGLSEQDIESLRKIYASFKKKNYTQICEALDANEAPILLLWEKSEKGRAIINKLDTSPEIADLSKPRMDTEFIPLENLRSMFYVYFLYVCLESQRGNGEIALEELLRMDSVCAKIDKNARFLVTKLVCMAVFTVDIHAADFIANNPRSPDKLLETLAVHFHPFPKNRLSLKNSIIFEHLTFENVLADIAEEFGAYRLRHYPIMKTNSTLRLHRYFTDEWLALEKDGTEIAITKLSVWPSIYPELPAWIDSEARVPWYYKAYNPVGSMLLEILLPAMERIVQIRTKVWISNDLLQIVLNKRLGKEISLKARAYSDEYIVDVEGRKIFSPGPDGKIDTNDDIKLPINPEVLGWEN